MFFQQASKDSAMTTVFVFAIATYRKVGFVRQSCEGIEQAAVFGPRHLGLIALHEAPPRCVVASGANRCDKRGARCKIRQPHVVPVVLCKMAFGNASRRATDCA